MYWSNPMHPTREQQLLTRLKVVFPDQLSRNYLLLFKDIDPTSSGKYVPWLVKIWMAATTSWPISEQESENLTEDAELLHELLQKFHRFKNQLPVEQRDILKHTKGSLATALKNFELPEGTKSQLYQKQIVEGMKLLHQDANYRVVRITTPEAAREIAKGTGWCVSSLKVAADYIASGSLVLIEKFDPKTDAFDSFILAHHGYARVQFHEESDPEFRATSQVKDTEDLDLQTTFPKYFKALQPYLQLAFDDAKKHRMRKFADAYDLLLYQEDVAEGREQDEQRASFDWSLGHGQLETDEEYITRLIDLAANIFGGRDPWIEARILEYGHEQLILGYVQATGTIAPELEAYLKSKWIIERYIDWAYAFTKDYHEVKIRAGQASEKEHWQTRLEPWLALVTRMRAKLKAK
jgi:hypothetical protein